MAIYAIWNNKGGVGKSYLTFQIACEYARQNPNKKVLVVDMCPQANSSSMLLGGMVDGEARLNEIHSQQRRVTISGYLEDRIASPYQSPNTGSTYLTKVRNYNRAVPDNLYLVVGDEQLETQASRVANATRPGPQDAWRTVHLWVADLIDDIQTHWNHQDSCVFIDCNPSFSIYTELALSAAERLLIPFSADGSSKRAVKAVLSLVYGVRRLPTDPLSEFVVNNNQFRLRVPEIYMYIGNRLTQMNNSSASAFKTVVDEIGDEIWGVWQARPNAFCIHPNGSQAPANRRTFKSMFQYEVNDANTASVVSGALGIPISTLPAGRANVAGRTIVVNQSQLDKQVPNVQSLVRSIE
ncbi:AAA family ATPase [Stenotrophomonas maltophilia]|uniref:ParA family protein n=1 Tax=Stenotrophomonas maltophilia TaxID=40324 RepID=UPI00237F38D3|nr:AAA family ATPase [Stenotrophomonas maltophilia]WDW02964.1 AAA family ATPase [Stenotrophomonas maltophilia]HEL3834510.1 AAA family ATPase [Stenotrophomonas maltophilia]HEL4226470.1 AAA family ATPase [Stenotrophomonas maltophilia]